MAPTFSMALYLKWGIKNCFTFAFFMIISGGLGGVQYDNFLEM